MAKGDLDPKVTVTKKERDAWRKRRQTLGWSVRELAPKTLVSHSAITHIETGRTTQIRTSVYESITRALFGAAAPNEGLEEMQQRERAIKKLMRALAEAGSDSSQIEGLAQAVRPLPTKT